MTGTSWGSSTAGQEEIVSGNYLKTEDLEGIAFTIYDFSFEPSGFDPKKEQVKISLTLDNEGDDEENDYLFTTTQSAIMNQMKKADPEELPFLDCTLYRPYDKPNSFGNWAYAIGPYAPPIKTNGKMQRDVREDNARQQVTKRPPVRTPVRSGPKSR